MIRILLILASFIASCSYTPQHLNKLKKLTDETKLVEVNWTNKNVKHYKKFIKTSIVSYPSAIDVFGYCGAFLFLELDDESFGTLNNELRNKAAYKSNVWDSCNLYITNDTKMNCRLGNVNLVPVPSMYNSYSPIVESDYSFSEDAEFYTLEFKKGIFLDDKYIDVGKQMLNDAINYNGYCKGAMVDKKNHIIVLYFMIW